MPYQNPYLQQGYGYQPYQSPQFQSPQYQSQQQPIHGFVYVTGLEGAKAYQMPPNSEMPLFDSTCDTRMFVKTTDGAGFPTIKVVACSTEESQPQTSDEWATKDDLRGLREEIEEIRRALHGGKHLSTSAE